jgi:DNA-binding XRE family transcriptional regulator
MTAAGRDPDRALFADELRAMRKRAGLTRDDLGSRVGIPAH